MATIGLPFFSIYTRLVGGFHLSYIYPFMIWFEGVSVCPMKLNHGAGAPLSALLGSEPGGD